MKLRLTIDVDYFDPASEAVAQLQLQAAAEHLASNGLLTGETSLETKSWSYDVRHPKTDFDRVVDFGQWLLDIENWGDDVGGLDGIPLADKLLKKYEEFLKGLEE